MSSRKLPRSKANVPSELDSVLQKVSVNPKNIGAKLMPISSKSIRGIKLRAKVNHDNTFDMDELDEQSEQNVFDLTGKFKQPSGVIKLYKTASEANLAMYAITQLINNFGNVVRHARSVNMEPSITSVTTNVNETTVVYQEICATIQIQCKGKMVDGIVMAMNSEDGYRISFSASTKEGVSVLDKMYNKMLEQHNFYQGKTLRYGGENVEFITMPVTQMKDAILSDETCAEIDLNVIQFLTNPEMSSITKKRGMLFYGPPGTGKTTSVKAMFRQLSSKNVTCIYLTDATFSYNSVEDVFAFINKYLAPALVVFEDIDLIAPDRHGHGSRLLGSLLSALNGVDEQQKPIAIVATTNRVEVLDAAVTRPCRFDRRIHVDYPTEKEMNTIFLNVAGFKAPDNCFKSSSEIKLTGAHVEEIYRTASLIAIKSSKNIKDCVTEAVEVVRKHFMIVSPKSIGFSEDVEGGEDCLETEVDYPTGNVGRIGR